MFCSLASVVVVCWRRLSSSVTLPGAWAVGRLTLHGGPVRLRPIKATPCFDWFDGDSFQYKDPSSFSCQLIFPILSRYPSTAVWFQSLALGFHRIYCTMRLALHWWITVSAGRQTARKNSWLLSGALICLCCRAYIYFKTLKVKTFSNNSKPGEQHLHLQWWQSCSLYVYCHQQLCCWWQLWHEKSAKELPSPSFL